MKTIELNKELIAKLDILKSENFFRGECECVDGLEINFDLDILTNCVGVAWDGYALVLGIADETKTQHIVEMEFPKLADLTNEDKLKIDSYMNSGTSSFEEFAAGSCFTDSLITFGIVTKTLFSE